MYRWPQPYWPLWSFVSLKSNRQKIKLLTCQMLSIKRRGEQVSKQWAPSCGWTTCYWACITYIIAHIIWIDPLHKLHLNFLKHVCLLPALILFCGWLICNMGNNLASSVGFKMLILCTFNSAYSNFIFKQSNSKTNMVPDPTWRSENEMFHITLTS